VKYSDLSYDLADRLSELLVMRSSSRSDLANLLAKFPSNQRELIACWTALVSTRGEMMAAFGRDFVLGPGILCGSRYIEEFPAGARAGSAGAIRD
jgi:hypothetical protein